MKETKREKLIRLLTAIGWSIRAHGADHYYLYDHHNRFTGYLLYGVHDTRIEHNLDNFAGGMHFYLSGCVIRFLDESKATVTVYPTGNQSVFIHFNNFDLK